MENKKVVIGVSGGIAVYKALDVISTLRKNNVEVKVIMTESATEFVSPLTFQSLSQNLVAVDMFAEPKAFEIQHISLAQWSDLMIIVPATANIIGKVANGIADDMLSTTIMASTAPVLFVPAMNTHMYENKIVQDNIKKLQDYGYEFIEPAEGRLACGDIGKGKLPDTALISEIILSKLYPIKDMVGQNVLVTAGPTVSPIDPVRFISNNSSGKMGYAIAEEARDRGANVVLISGPTSLKPPVGVEVISVKTNGEMYNEVLSRYDSQDIVIKAAAVADYKVEEYSTRKIKKSSSDLQLKFVRDNDILKTLGDKKQHQILVGFAAESNDIIENAIGKIERKNLDYIVANDITAKDTGFESNYNKVIIIDKTGKQISLDKMSKRKVAKNLFDEIKRR
ncbi:bifunctional phosphopantothenoylcysteine decarboxylase/phosphopantothenate--cysteine ligase CoaBC [Inconstantimicrobium mannanitabidum]|uniref:Phosphopantothenoylcysteine decarboxylase n=1 Tax=Inconstantimicrobium mannanitabidum TaxID=1604901 RepID=A0ACB5RB58_9CLOT|nr:bifunctional phosphopantothenoylcysteine decarboxylase/phosphopantothenate--cysteine ligase CoaBC [Clostridium sp. TW13]GKX66253.1 phosphopantothenoylcysteine decarboxylase [Clostridium sp. TW13]